MRVARPHASGLDAGVGGGSGRAALGARRCGAGHAQAASFLLRGFERARQIPGAVGAQARSESSGRIRIDLFPSMQLGGAPAQLFDQLRDGTADIVWAAPSHTPGRFPKIEVFELPFLPSRRALVVLEGAPGFRPRPI